jgi:hypothetical protein
MRHLESGAESRPATAELIPPREKKIELHRPKPLRAAQRKPGQGPPPLQRIFRNERRPAGGQCATRVPVGQAYSLSGLGLA